MKKYLILLLCAVMSLVSCSGDDVIPDVPDAPTPDPTPQLNISTSEDLSPSFGPDGGTATVSFTTNKNWNAKVIDTSATWCTVSPVSGGAGTNSITMSIKPNDTPDSRTAAIELAVGTITRTINVSQKQKDALTVTSNRFEIPKEGGEIEIEARANIDLEYQISEEGSSWISYVGTRAMKTSYLSFKVAENDSTVKREAKVILTGAGLSEEVIISQEPAEMVLFSVSPDQIEVGADMCSFELSVTSSKEYEIKSLVDWIVERTTRSDGTYSHIFEVRDNPSNNEREGVITITNEKQKTITVPVKQKGAERDYYVSSDYSQDGTIVQLQSASEGNGIGIVLMGDGYSDKQIEDGTYKTDMENAYNSLFSIEPFKSFKMLFNVSYVNVVSPVEGFEHSKTALDCGFGDGTYVYGNDQKCFDYALKAIQPQKMDETLVVVIMNSNRYSGTCFMYYPTVSGTDYGKGVSIAYFTKGEDKEVLADLLHHEACGHGFAKLADEYAYEQYGTIPDAEASDIRQQQDLYGWWKNVDFTSAPEQVRWHKFLEDSRYAKEGLGVFEGGLTYFKGVWRPSVNSIMNDNKGVFNAPSREAIYYRIQKLAYGTEWVYDYEKFVEYDAVNYNKPSTRFSGVSPLRPQHQLHPPVVVKRSWK